MRSSSRQPSERMRLPFAVKEWPQQSKMAVTASYIYLSLIHIYDDLGRYYIEELDVMQVPEHLQNYIDYEAYGRDVALEENGTFTDQGLSLIHISANAL